MKTSSPLPLHALSFNHWSLKGEEVGIIVVKCTFACGHGSDGGYLAEQPEILLTDLFHGVPNESALRQEAELAPWLPKTDVTFNAIARSPEGKALESWPVRVSVGDRASMSFQVCGKRMWEPSGQVTKSWKLSAPEVMTELPLRYEYAYGGQVEDAENEIHVHEFNPVGRGFLGPLQPGTEARPAPQIGLQPEFIAGKPDEPWTVCGLGPIGKAWLPRRALAGTFDEAWLRERHPRMPTDYEFSYWNGAPLPLQIGPYLKGDEIITATGLRHDPRPYEIALPGVTPLATVRRHNGQSEGPYPLHLQSVHCDIADADPDKHWISLVWRMALADPGEVAEITIAAQNMPPVYRPKLKPALSQANASAKPMTASERREQEWATVGVSYADELRYVKELEKKRAQEARAQKIREARLTERGWSPQSIAIVRALGGGEPVSGWSEGEALLIYDPETRCPLAVPANPADSRILHIGMESYAYRYPNQKDEWPSDMAKPEPSDPWHRQPPSERPEPVLVRLLDENIDVWRPVMARQMQGDCYCLLPVERLPKGERWEFGMMAYVHCEMRAYMDGVFLTAVRRKERDKYGNYRF